MIIIPKITVLSLLLILSLENFIPQNAINFVDLNIFFLITGSLSLIIGSCALVQQWKIKRFLAYSGISHIGFILLALYCYDLYSYIIYFIIYAITTINIFCILLVISQSQGQEIKYIEQLIGLFKFNPYLSISLALNLFSLAGRYVCFIFLLMLKGQFDN